MTIAGYGRVSTTKDAQLDSLENQIDFFGQYAEKHGYTLYRVYADEGISGKQMKNRNEFLRMIEDAKLHLFDMVVVKDISRFSRNTVDLLTAIRELKASGIEVQFLSNNQTVLGNSEFVITVFGALAQEESASLSKRVKFGKRINAEKGRVPHNIYGYRQIDTFHLEIVEEEARTVRWIFRKYLEEGWGTRRVAAELNAAGSRSRAGVLWRAATVRRLMKNPIYCGILETNKSETVDFITGRRRDNSIEERFRLERPELRIVSQKDWQKAQEVLKRRADVYGSDSEKAKAGMKNRYSSQHLFSSMIRCEACGYSYCRKSWTTKKSGKVFYWACSGRNNFTSEFCPNGHTVNEQKLIHGLEEYFQSMVVDKAAFIQRALERADASPQGSRQESADSITQRIDTLKRKEQKYKEMYANDLLTLEELKDCLQRISKDSRELQERYLQAACFEKEEKDRKQQLLEQYGQLEKLLDISEWTNADLREVVDHISVSAAGGITVHMKLFLDRITQYQ